MLRFDFLSRPRGISVTSPATSALRKASLNAVHRRMGARMVSFGGWDMPVEYPATGGLIAEHLAVRTGVGLFDVSHMGDIFIEAAPPGGPLPPRQHLHLHHPPQPALHPHH